MSVVSECFLDPNHFCASNEIFRALSFNAICNNCGQHIGKHGRSNIAKRELTVQQFAGTPGLQSNQDMPELVPAESVTGECALATSFPVVTSVASSLNSAVESTSSTSLNTTAEHILNKDIDAVLHSALVSSNHPASAESLVDITNQTDNKTKVFKKRARDFFVDLSASATPHDSPPTSKEGVAKHHKPESTGVLSSSDSV